MDSEPNLSDLTDAASPQTERTRFCVLGRTDALEWEDCLDGLNESDWPDFDLVKAPDEDWVEIYVFAVDEEAAHAAVEAQAVYLGLPELTDVAVHDAGPSELGPSI